MPLVKVLFQDSRFFEEHKFDNGQVVKARPRDYFIFDVLNRIQSIGVNLEPGQSWTIRSRKYLLSLIAVNHPVLLLAIALRSKSKIKITAALFACRHSLNGKVPARSAISLSQHEDRTIRRQAIRLLCSAGQMQWVDIALTQNPDAGLSNAIRGRNRESFQARMNQYLDAIECRETENWEPQPSKRIQLAADLDLGARQKHPPKASWWIRFLLERIHLLVQKSK